MSSFPAQLGVFHVNDPRFVDFAGVYLDRKATRGRYALRPDRQAYGTLLSAERNSSVWGSTPSRSTPTGSKRCSIMTPLIRWHASATGNEPVRLLPVGIEYSTANKSIVGELAPRDVFGEMAIFERQRAQQRCASRGPRARPQASVSPPST